MHIPETQAVAEDSDWETFFNDSIWFTTPPANIGSPAFCSLSTFAFEGTSVEYYVETVTTCGIYGNLSNEGTFNCGYTNKNTGASYGYALYIENGGYFEVDPPSGIELAVHASTHDAKSDWLMRVDGKRVFTNS